MAFSLSRTRDFTVEVAEELKKVTWPDWPQLKNATIVIMVFCAIVAAIIKLMDIFAAGIIKVILGLFAR
jgi:preprotein translocase subunit SecE